VPILEAEARFLVDLVDGIPVTEQTRILARWRKVIRTLAREGLLRDLRKVNELSEPTVRDLTLGYFHLQIPCPFLDGARCAIYDNRPLSCREYMVTSPSGNCARFGESEILRVRMPGSILTRLTTGPTGTQCRVPLVLAFEKAVRGPPRQRRSSGPELLAELLGIDLR
jgi:hypothetical protein